MPLVQTRGAASAQGFGEFAQAAPAANYIEDVFSTYLYTGNGSTQTITNGIDLAGKGGLVWTKCRQTGTNHGLFDTVRGGTNILKSNSSNPQVTSSGYITAFNSNGWTMGGNTENNLASAPICSWTFRKQAKFFDIVTYTGNGTAGRAISHSLGSTPGCVIVKATDLTQKWTVFHRSLGGTKALALNLTDTSDTDISYWNNSNPTSTTFIVGGDGGSTNNNGTNYVAYLFAHDAGGFGATGTDNVISCGSYTGNGSIPAPTVTLGYEPQWVLIKATNASDTSYGNWAIFDSMRGIITSPTADPRNAQIPDPYLRPNTSGAEDTATQVIKTTATGFQIESDSPSAYNESGTTYIYIAIRRGPMKTPTSGTEVFYPKVHAGSSSYSVGFPTDLCLAGDQSGNALNTVAVYRLAGNSAYFGGTASTDAEQSASVCQFDLQNSFQLSYNSNNQARWHFRRAPGFFDEVCYTGNGGYVSYNHNLTVVPEMMIVKSRSVGGSSYPWAVYHSALGIGSYLRLNTTGAPSTTGDFWYLSPTTTQFSVGGYTPIADTGVTYVAYLFATVAGVSKVGSYTGNGGTQAIACGFTGGARFVLIKRTDSTGDWYVYDTARGMTLLTDPYLLLNSTAAEAATLGSVTTTTGGFTVDATILAAINTNTASYIFLAIA